MIWALCCSVEATIAILVLILILSSLYAIGLFYQHSRILGSIIFLFNIGLILNKKRGGQQPSIAEFAAPQLEQLWHWASIPTVSHTRIVNNIRKCIDTYKVLLKCLKSRQLTSSYKVKVNKSRGNLSSWSICRHVHATLMRVNAITFTMFLWKISFSSLIKSWIISV